MSKLNFTLLMLLMVAWAAGSRADEPTFDGLKNRLASPDYETRQSAVIDLRHLGQKRPLKKQEIELLLPHLKSDADWRIKTRITWVLPSAENTDWVLTPLLDALLDRQAESSGEGNVPGAACRNLSRLGDVRALQPMREWLEFLESHPNVYPGLRKDWIAQAEKWISNLETKQKEKGTDKPL